PSPDDMTASLEAPRKCAPRQSPTTVAGVGADSARECQSRLNRVTFLSWHSKHAAAPTYRLAAMRGASGTTATAAAAASGAAGAGGRRSHAIAASARSQALLCIAGAAYHSVLGGDQRCRSRNAKIRVHASSATPGSYRTWSNGRDRNEATG